MILACNNAATPFSRAEIFDVQVHCFREFRYSDNVEFILVAAVACWRRCQIQNHKGLAAPVFNPENTFARRVLPELVRYLELPPSDVRCPSLRSAWHGTLKLRGDTQIETVACVCRAFSELDLMLL